MRCPLCLDAELTVHVRDGIEVDRCPRCRGTWLDRGELDKLLDLAEARSPEPRIVTPSASAGRVPAPLPRDRSDHREREDRSHERRGGKRKRKGALAELLEDVFDAFD